jgi:hypothetical protein
LQLTLAFVFLALFVKAANAQGAEFLPEMDVYLKLNSNVRLLGQVSNTRDGSDPTQLNIGPDLDVYVKPLVKLKEITAFDLDDAKSRPLAFSVGYRFLPTPGAPATNRMVLTATSRLPAKTGLLLTDRNRADLDWTNGEFKWRYRNKVEIEKPLTIRSFHPAPYASVEVYYEEQYQKWSTTEIDVGCLFPMKKRFEFEAYYEHENNTGKHPNEQVNGLGLTLYMYFSAR